MASSLEERVERIERSLRRSRLFTYARLAFYIFMIVGVLAYAASLYRSMDEWRFELAYAPRLGVSGFPVVHVQVPLKIYNPDGDVMARLVYYKIYINGYYAGDGFIPYLSLPKGWSEHKLEADIDLSRASCGLAEALRSGSEVEVRVQGYAMIDLKAFGKIPWRTVTVPFNVTATNATVPDLPGNVEALLSLYLLVCNNSGSLLEVLARMLEAQNVTGGLPPITPPTGGAGNVSNLSISTSVTPRPLEGVFTLTINITNTGSSPITLLRVTYNGVDLLGSPQELPPGGSVIITHNTTVVPGVLRVVTDKGAQSIIVGPGG